MATIPGIEARIHALGTKGEARTREDSVALGRLLTALRAEMPPGDFSRHVQEVLHIPERDAQHVMTQARTSQGADHGPVPEGSVVHVVRSDGLCTWSLRGQRERADGSPADGAGVR